MIETYGERLAEMRERVEIYLDNFRSTPLYDFEDTPERLRAYQALSDCIELYAQRGVEAPGVEACARAYVRACKRPEAAERRIEQGAAHPPAPPPGTYPGKVQPAYRERMSKPPAMPFALTPVPSPEGEPTEFDPDAWHIGEMLLDYTPVAPNYFVERPIKAGDMVYVKLNGNSVERFKPELWAVQVIHAEQGISYYFYVRENPVRAYQAADFQEELDKAWIRGFNRPR